MDEVLAGSSPMILNGFTALLNRRRLWRRRTQNMSDNAIATATEQTGTSMCGSRPLAVTTVSLGDPPYLPVP